MKINKRSDALRSDLLDAGRQENVSRSPIRVVVIDDHEMILQSIVRLITADPRFEVVGTAITASEGIDITTRERPDVLVIDYRLPDMDAPDAIRIVRSLHPDVKIVTFSGSERPGAQYASMRAGSSAWVRKTRAIQELRDAITGVVQGQGFKNEDMEIQPRVDELVVHYQPVIDLQSDRIVGFEALVRWMHPERGLLLPDAFLPQAEETGYVEEIDRFVRASAINQLAIWQRDFPSLTNLWMSVNMSSCDIANPDLCDSIANLIKQAGVAPKDIVVEVTENVLLDDSTKTHEFLNQLSAVGVGLALDDFGTAFSSVSYVRQFPFNLLKLDISFTADLPTSLRSMLLVEEIGHLADSMSMIGIAEGIEREDQRDALRDMGWKYGQGFFFSKALSARDCEQLLIASLVLQKASA
jgi:EAL domain-containing protein (putative c-di-GMP-specific phosphodiesterase class I)